MLGIWSPVISQDQGKSSERLRFKRHGTATARQSTVHIYECVLLKSCLKT